MFLSAGSFQDWLALATLLSSWIGYTCYASYKAGNAVCLSSVLARYRQDWMVRSIARENRTSDAVY